ncbi:BrnT family toxin [uncultured Lamprocystis sp.]|uniref:BrnT family toxin n=1 Tax=uncultured Lamprocystis sp. TaxID=543132 RepID=UPI00344254A2
MGLKANLAKHGVDCRDCESVLSDLYALIHEDREHAEERYTTIRVDDLGRLLIVAYTWRDRSIRLISARRATTQERRAEPVSRPIKLAHYETTRR